MKSSILLLLSAGAVVAHGQNLIQNSSFEDPAIPGGPSALDSVAFFPGGSTIGGSWNVSGATDRNVLVVNESFNNFFPNAFTPAQSGTQYLDLSGAYFTGTAPLVSQDFPTVPGENYLVSFFLGASDGFNAEPGSQHAPFDSVNVRIDDVSGPNLLNRQLTPPAPSAGAIQWKEQSFSFTAASSLTRLSFQDLSGYDDNTSFVDSVSVQRVPEGLPQVWAVGAIVGTLAAASRRKVCS